MQFLSIFIILPTSMCLPTRMALTGPLLSLNAVDMKLSNKERHRAKSRLRAQRHLKFLPEIITQPTSIKDAWGPGSHQFLYEGATLKCDDSGRTTGIDRDAFNK